MLSLPGMLSLAGLSAFPLTPTNPQGRVDTQTLRKLVARLVDAQVNSIGLLGSTGIYMYLTREERRRAVEAAMEETHGRTPLVVGIGALRTDDAVSLAQDARAIGADAGLLSAASYTPLTQDEVFEHFSTVAAQSGLPIIIYDNPGTTHFQFTPELVARLARVPGLIAIKNPGVRAEETAHHLARQRAQVPEHFSIGCSGDWMAAETMIAGADTWYSVLGGLLPKLCLGIVRAAQQGDAIEARRLNAALTPLWDLFRQHSGLRVTYAMAEHLDLCHAQPPRPILPLPQPVKQQVAEVLAALRALSDQMESSDRSEFAQNKQS